MPKTYSLPTNFENVEQEFGSKAGSGCQGFDPWPDLTVSQIAEPVNRDAETQFHLCLRVVGLSLLQVKLEVNYCTS